MNSYRISYAEFFSFNKNPTLKDYFNKHSAQCKKPINELIKKYDLSNSKVLSIGPKTGHEEFWFYENGCDLTFVDIDEDNNLKPMLEELSLSQPPKSLTYILDDAQNIQNYASEKYDVVYFSSFTPNELRNWDIVSKRNLSFKNKVLNRIAHHFDISRLNKKWPPGELPFAPLTLEIIENSVKKNGILIYQSHASGVDSRNQDYLKLLKDQLYEIGIILIHVYNFIDFPGVHLVIGLKSSQKRAGQFMTAIKHNPEITYFHGRAKNNLGSTKGIKKIYEFDTD